MSSTRCCCPSNPSRTRPRKLRGLFETRRGPDIDRGFFLSRRATAPPPPAQANGKIFTSNTRSQNQMAATATATTEPPRSTTGA
jgi:hypothetical protein